MIGAFLVIGILICQIRFGIIRTGEIRANFLAITWPYAVLVGGLFLRHLVRTPYKLDEGLQAEIRKKDNTFGTIITERLAEIDLQKQEITKLTEAAKHHYAGRPGLTLRLAASCIDANTDEDSVFRVQNCGTRTARWVKIGSIRSSRGNFLLSFGQIAVLSPGPGVGIGCQVGFGDYTNTLLEFFRDMDLTEEGATTWFDVTIECRDLDESVVETMVRIMFDSRNNGLAIRAVPYTQVPPEQPIQLA